MVVSAFALQELMRAKKEQNPQAWLAELEAIYGKTVLPYDQARKVGPENVLFSKWHVTSSFSIAALYLLNLSAALGTFPVDGGGKAFEETFGINYPSSNPQLFFPDQDAGSERPINLFRAMEDRLGAPGDLVWLRPNARLLAESPDGPGLGKWGGENRAWHESNGLGLVIDIDHDAREMTVLYGIGFGTLPVYKRYKLDESALPMGADEPDEASLSNPDEIVPVRIINGYLLPMQFDYAPYDGPLPQSTGYEILKGLEVVNGETVGVPRWMLMPAAVQQLIACVRTEGAEPPLTATTDSGSKPASSSGVSAGKVVVGAGLLGLIAWGLSKALK